MSDEEERPEEERPDEEPSEEDRSEGEGSEGEPSEDVTPDTEVGEPPPPSNGDELEGDERPIQWRPGRRHGRSAESERPE